MGDVCELVQVRSGELGLVRRCCVVGNIVSVLCLFDEVS